MPGPTIIRPQPGDEVASAWGTSVADALNGIQTGTGTLPAAAAASSTLVVTFPKPYVSAPVVVLTGLSANSGAQLPSTTAVGATSFTAYQRHRSDANVLAAPFQWVAIGTLA